MMQEPYYALYKAHQELNEQWFDGVLEMANIAYTTRGNFGIRYDGDNVYTFNPEHTISHDDLIREMVYQLYNRPHPELDVTHKEIKNELPGRGFGQSDCVIWEGVPTQKQPTKMKKFTCRCGQIARATTLHATCNKCGGEFKEV